MSNLHWTPTDFNTYAIRVADYFRHEFVGAENVDATLVGERFRAEIEAAVARREDVRDFAEELARSIDFAS